MSTSAREQISLFCYSHCPSKRKAIKAVTVTLGSYGVNILFPLLAAMSRAKNYAETFCRDHSGACDPFQNKSFSDSSSPAGEIQRDAAAHAVIGFGFAIGAFVLLSIAFKCCGRSRNNTTDDAERAGESRALIQHRNNTTNNNVRGWYQRAKAYRPSCTDMAKMTAIFFIEATSSILLIVLYAISIQQLICPAPSNNKQSPSPAPICDDYPDTYTNQQLEPLRYLANHAASKAAITGVLLSLFVSAASSFLFVAVNSIHKGWQENREQDMRDGARLNPIS